MSYYVSHKINLLHNENKFEMNILYVLHNYFVLWATYMVFWVKLVFIGITWKRKISYSNKYTLAALPNCYYAGTILY